MNNPRGGCLVLPSRPSRFHFLPFFFMTIKPDTRSRDSAGDELNLVSVYDPGSQCGAKGGESGGIDS